MRLKILVTAIGSFSADCVISSLKCNGHYVVGCDIYNGMWHAVTKDLISKR
jgi:carbamoyl-phosphate synthase large subunit